MRALGLAHHWQRLLDEGHYSSLQDIAQAEGIDLGRASKVLRLTLLSPSVIGVVLAKREAVAGLAELQERIPLSWDAQDALCSVPASLDVSVRALP